MLSDQKTVWCEAGNQSRELRYVGPLLRAVSGPGMWIIKAGGTNPKDFRVRELLWCCPNGAVRTYIISELRNGFINAICIQMH